MNFASDIPSSLLRRVVGCAVCCVLAITSESWAEPTPGSAEFFESRIRPVLVEHCLECHAPQKKVRGGLRLDHRAGWQTGGDSGPAIVPGKPEESLVLDALRYTDVTLKMPPKGKLSDTVIRDFEQWIKAGAPDPRTDDLPKPTQKRAGPPPEQYWSYQPLRHTPPRQVTETRSMIDQYVDDKLREHHLSPAPLADRDVLARRIYFDLWGLPPTPEQITEFVHDQSPDAWPRLVDRLLAAPEFGERWGRHWLDIVRFAESLTLRGFVFPEAWRYRDYVIRAFNEDRPYNRFLIEQLAGDLLPENDLARRQQNLIATTFLMLGNSNLEEQDKKQLEMDLLDEQLDVIGKAFLGQTFGCVRCHDHKFDPLSHRDYYAMAAIFANVKTLEHANVSKWVEVLLPAEAEVEAKSQKLQQELASLDQDIKEIQKRLSPQGNSKPAKPIPVSDLPGVVVDDTQAKIVGGWRESRSVTSYVGTGYLVDDNQNKGSLTVTFNPLLPRDGLYEVRMAYTAAKNRSSKTPVTIFSAEGEKTILVDQRDPPPFDGLFYSLGTFRFEVAGQAFVIVSNEDTDGHVAVDALQFLPRESMPAKTPSGAAQPAPTTSRDQEALTRLQGRKHEVERQIPQRPRIQSVKEKAIAPTLPIHIRGNVHQLGAQVSRGVPAVFRSVPTPQFSDKTSGRLEFAHWLTDVSHPLTSRVFVNRVWHWLFGAGIVRSVDNFGTTGELPSHPELLDALALKFQSQGWSPKRLIREIVLSEVYRRQSTPARNGMASDVENRWLSRTNRRRLDAECLRDAMLVCSGTLSPRRGGPGFPVQLESDYGFLAKETCRSVYLPAFRNSLPEFLEVFDLADPSLVTGARGTSTISPQALFLMNHPFVQEHSRTTARRLLDHPGLDESARVIWAYRMVLGRSPSPEELQACIKFLNAAGPTDPQSRHTRWSELVQGLFASVDFRYLD